MNQYFTHYKNWEDYQNGMWTSHEKSKEIELVELATQCLLNPKEPMLKVINQWSESTKVNLTNLSSNRKSWLGQAACCLEYGVPETLTRAAWNNLTEEQRNNANEIAKQVIEQWEKNFKN